MESLAHEERHEEVVSPIASGPETMRLAQALVHDLRASLHGLSLTIQMALGGVPNEGQQPVRRFLCMASAETAALDRTIEQLGLWVRIVGEHYRPRIDRLDLCAALHEQHSPAVHLPGHPVMVYADRHLVPSALDGVLSFVQACAAPGEEARVDLTSEGQIVIRGPEHWLPVFRTVVADPIPDLHASRGPAKWLVGLALAVASCRICGGQVHLRGFKDRCELTLAWRLVHN